MAALRIHHNTTYRYREPVTLLPHRLMLRPRESPDLRIVRTTLSITPRATVTWANDVFSNAVATATFDARADTLSIDSTVDLELHAKSAPEYDVATSARNYPFLYGADEWTDLGALTTPQYPDADGRLRDWAHGFIHSNPTGTLALLYDLSDGV